MKNKILLLFIAILVYLCSFAIAQRGDFGMHESMQMGSGTTGVMGALWDENGLALTDENQLPIFDETGA